MLEPALILLAAYLWGGIPSAYLVSRYVRGIDIRRYGSRNPGSSNVMEHVGRWTGLSVGVFESIGKGTLPVMVANLLDQSLAMQAGAGLAAIVGHNWSPYMRFTGGRGMATAIGVLFGLMMWRELLVEAVVFGVIGRLLLRETGFWSLIAMLTLPALAYVFRQPAELVLASVGIGSIIILKRLTANWERPRGGSSLLRVVQYRVLWDRDVPRREEWTTRQPGTN